MNPKQLSLYNNGAKICGIVMKYIKDKIESGESDILLLHKLGNKKIQEECNNNKGIAFPVSISLNNCIGDYVYQIENDNYNKIKEGDVIKIELGVNLDGCVSNFGETLVKTESRYNQYLDILNKLQEKITKRLRIGKTNDDIKRSIESYCIEHECFPVENCISYQQIDGHSKTSYSKYIVLNHQKYYDDDNSLLVESDTCFEFEEHEVYNINLSIFPKTDDITDLNDLRYTEPHNSHIYRLNEYYYALKLKSSREFFSTIKTKHGNNAFYIGDYLTNPKYKIGIRETVDVGILDELPIRYIWNKKEQLPVFHKKFTVIVGKSTGILLTY